MRLGGPVQYEKGDPIAWAKAHRAAGYSATYTPDTQTHDDLDAYAAVAKEYGLVIAEVGAWSNPLSDDPETHKAAMTKCINGLARAERVGARCCVNIAGSRGKVWDGPDDRNLSRETFDMIVEQTRQIIDAVKPTRAFYTLETMPWVFPDGPDEYLQLVKAIDRKQFAVHLDPVNIVNSPRRIYDTGALIRECFDKLGPYIKSSHAKDIKIADKLTLHLDECVPGTGRLDYAEYLRQLDRLDPDTPLMLEHMKTPEEYKQAADHVRAVAKENGVTIR